MKRQSHNSAALRATVSELGDLDDAHPDYVEAVLAANRPQLIRDEARLRLTRQRRAVCFGALLLLSTMTGAYAPFFCLLSVILELCMIAFWSKDLTLRRVLIAAHIAGLGVHWYQKFLKKKEYAQFTPNFWLNESIVPFPFLNLWEQRIGHSLLTPIATGSILAQLAFVARSARSNTNRSLIIRCLLSGGFLAIVQYLHVQMTINNYVVQFKPTFWGYYQGVYLLVWFFIGVTSLWFEAWSSRCKGIAVISPGLIWALLIFVSMVMSTKLCVWLIA